MDIFGGLVIIAISAYGVFIIHWLGKILAAMLEDWSE